MAHFAKIDSNNTVVEVLVIEQAEINTGNWGDPASFVQTSYNTRQGLYYTPGTYPPVLDSDQSKALHKNFAGIGSKWDGIGFYMPQPYPSWTLNNFSYTWQAPKQYPQDKKLYIWDEPTLSWVISDMPNESSYQNAPPRIPTTVL